MEKCRTLDECGGLIKRADGRRMNGRLMMTVH